MNMLRYDSRYAGVTLLEAMLVLVLISTIIVMSMRYYQGASNNSQITGAVAALQNAAGSIESYGATSTGSGVSAFKDDNLTNKLSPLGAISVDTAAATTSTVQIKFANVPSSDGAVCSGITSAISSSKWSANSGCASFTYKYTS